MRTLKNSNRLMWFRNDLRLFDNESLSAALSAGSGEIRFVFIYDSRFDSLTAEGKPRAGEFRKRFLAESVCSLGEQLLQLGAELCYLTGHPEDLIPEICEQHQVTDLYHSRCTSFDEHQIEQRIRERLQSTSVAIHSFQTQTLICDSDIKDFDLYKPMSFSKLRKFAEKNWPIRPARVAPVSLHDASPKKVSKSFTRWPCESFLNKPVTSKGIWMVGGEAAALARVQDFIWQGGHLRTYKETRNGLIELDDSSKFSPALAAGCLSPRHLYHEIRKFELEREKNSSTLWFLYELLWRDHFHFMAQVRGHGLFTDQVEVGVEADREGTADTAASRSERATAGAYGTFESWREGRTGIRFVDAAMIELASTGWLSNRMRQVAASYLVHDLKVNWKWGARWFETCLIDYDPCSNWGNWSYIAGAGAMNKPHIFDIMQQAQCYDPQGAYQDDWMT